MLNNEEWIIIALFYHLATKAVHIVVVANTNGDMKHALLSEFVTSPHNSNSVDYEEAMRVVQEAQKFVYPQYQIEATK